MDKNTLQKVKTLSQEIVEEKFPEEAEYFGFVYNITMEEIEELEPGKEEEFLKDIRAMHPELALGFASIIITFTVQILRDNTYSSMTDEVIKRKILSAVKIKYPTVFKNMKK